jgi:hypothetical protein
MTDKDEEVTAGEVVPYDTVEHALLDPTVRIEDDPEEAARGIIERILGSNSPDDVLAEDRVVHAKDYLDTPFIAHNVRFMGSTASETGGGVYAAIDASTKDGEPFVMTCGARNVVAQLFRLSTMNALPREVMLVERGVARPGRSRPLRLVKPDTF